MKNNMRQFPSYPAVSYAIRKAWGRFVSYSFTDAELECAQRFDVTKAIEKAEAERKAAGIDNP